MLSTTRLRGVVPLALELANNFGSKSVGLVGQYNDFHTCCIKICWFSWTVQGCLILFVSKSVGLVGQHTRAPLRRMKRPIWAHILLAYRSIWAHIEVRTLYATCRRILREACWASSSAHLLLGVRCLQTNQGSVEDNENTKQDVKVERYALHGLTLRIAALQPYTY